MFVHGIEIRSVCVSPEWVQVGTLVTNPTYWFTVHDIVAYFPEARTVEAEQQPLLGNGPYTRRRGTRYVRCDVTQQQNICWGVLCGSAPQLVATQLCSKHISVSVNQHATTEEAVFFVDPPRGYITRISRSYNWNWVQIRSWQLGQRIGRVGSRRWLRMMARRELGCAKKA
jgi:hypothetical protein